ncbi:MAG: phytoene desaturase family protein [Thermoanaerobaculia bacterium]
MSARASAALQDAVIVGGGHNGLVAAAYMARAGLRPLVLERREVVGGAAVTEEFHSGFRVPTLAHSADLFQESVVRELGLDRHGLQLLRPSTRLFAPGVDGAPAVRIDDDPGRTAQALSPLSAADAGRYVEYHESLSRIGRLLAPLLTMTPPPVGRPATADLWKLLGVGRGFRGLPKRDAYRLLRWGPMAVADLASEWFESERLRAIVAARGILGMFAGPWSAGTSANLLLQAAEESRSMAAPRGSFVKGGVGALTAALAYAAGALGAEIRTGAEVAQIRIEKGRATGVVLSSGEEIPARVVVSNADPKRTFLRLVDPMHLDPDFLVRIRNYRCFGVAAKVNFALSGLPRFAGADEPDLLSGAIHVGPDVDYLERAFDAAKYGRFSPEPYVRATIPSVLDPGLAPAGSHVLSAYVQYAPYELEKSDWEIGSEPLGDAVTAILARYAPDFPRLVVHRQVVTPRDIESVYGLTGAHIFHGEHALDQLFLMRPVLGWARYRTPICGLYLCGAGTHPGGGLTGLPGANASREVLRDWKMGRRGERRDRARAESA